MPNSFWDNGTYNVKDIDTGNFVGKVHVENAATDIAGGRGYVVHYALVKSNPESGWGVYAKPTQQGNKSFKYEPTGESLAQFLAWVNDTGRKPNLRYIFQGVREKDAL